MGRLRDYESIVACLSEEEIDEMQAAIDARREARAGPPNDLEAEATEAGAHPTP